MMSSSEIIEKFRDIEKQKFNGLIKKRGVDIIISPIIENTPDLADVDVISDLYGVDTVGSKQYEGTKKTFGNDFPTRMVVVESDSEWKKLANDEYSRFADNDTSNDFTQTNNNITNVIIMHDLALRVGTKIRLEADENVKYTIARTYKKRAMTNLYRYRLTRD